MFVAFLTFFFNFSNCFKNKNRYTNSTQILIIPMRTPQNNRCKYIRFCLVYIYTEIISLKMNSPSLLMMTVVIWYAFAIILGLEHVRHIDSVSSMLLVTFLFNFYKRFLQRCMECRRGLAMIILSVRPSVKRVNCDKTEETCVQIFIPYQRTFSLVFWEKEWLVRAIPSTWNFGSTGPRWSKIADFEPIFVRRASAVTPSEKVQLALIGRPLRAFQWAQDKHRTLCLTPKSKVSKIWTISCDNSETVQDEMSVTINH